MEHEPRPGWREQLRILMHERTLTIVTVYVFCAGAWIAATDWLIAYFAQNARALPWLSTVKGELFVGGTALLLLLHLRRERQAREAHEARIRQQAVVLEAAAQHMQESEERYRAMFEFGPFPKVLYDPADFAIVAVNAAAVELYGYSRDELLAMTIKDVRPQAEIDRLVMAFAQPHPERYHAGIWTHRRKDGTLLDVDVYSHALVPGGRRLQLDELHDVTDARRAEAALRRANRALRMISFCSQHVVRARDEQALLDGLCRILVEQGGYRLVWVGYAEHDTEQTVRPVASSGAGGDFVHAARISWGENERGQGPTGRAIRTGVPCHAHSLQTDPTFGPWRDEARRHGYLASVALPLRANAQVLGALNFYAGEVPAFDQEETALLMELADDLVYGVLALRTRVDRERAEQALALRTEQLEAVRAVTAEITRELELPTVLQLITQRACVLTGATAGDLDLWDEERQVLVPEATYGHVADRPMTTRKHGEGAMDVVAQRRQGLIINDYRTSGVAHPSTLAHTQIMASLIEPLLYGDRLLGVIGVDHESEGQTFTAHDQATLKLFAAQAAIAIENARLYEAVRTHAAELEARVQARTRELEAANRQLLRASRFKSEFLANMSHEIRTPLNSILGFAQLLREQTKEIFSPKQTRFLTNIHRSGEHLLQLINDILDLSKVEAGKTTFEVVSLDVPQVLEDILVIARGLAHKKSQSIETQIAPDLPPLRADPLRLKQICFNLLSNAVKFTPDRGRITVAAQSTPDAAFLDIRVTDTGIGIRAEDLPRLFQEFVQLDTTRSQWEEGTGLGLALTTRLVELHGGTLTATSPGEGQGSTFTVRLPFAGPAAPAGVG